MQEYSLPVMKRAPKATPHAKAAAIDMLINCGLGAAKWTWFKALVRNDVRDAARRLKVTATTANGRRLPGLVRRRAEAVHHHGIQQVAGLGESAPDKRAKGIKAACRPGIWEPDDFAQGVAWLIKLGYLDRFAKGDRSLITAAVRRFQEAHPQLDNDGVLGRATLDQIQRVIDLKAKSGKGAAGAGAGAATGAADQAVAATGYGDLILYGSLAALVIGGIYLAWRYRDELEIALRGAGTLRKMRARMIEVSQRRLRHHLVLIVAVSLARHPRLSVLARGQEPAGLSSGLSPVFVQSAGFSRHRGRVLT
jgi:lysozyme